MLFFSSGYFFLPSHYSHLCSSSFLSHLFYCLYLPAPLPFFSLSYQFSSLLFIYAILFSLVLFSPPVLCPSSILFHLLSFLSCVYVLLHLFLSSLSFSSLPFSLLFHLWSSSFFHPLLISSIFSPFFHLFSLISQSFFFSCFWSTYLFSLFSLNLFSFPKTIFSTLHMLAKSAIAL